MPSINEATSTDLKVIEALRKLGWKPEDTLLYQQEYKLTPEQQLNFPGIKSIKPDIVLTDLKHDVLAVFENKLEDEKKALTKLRTLYYQILKPRFLYACSPERILFYDTTWKGLDAGEFRRVSEFMSLEEINVKIEQEKKRSLAREITIDTTIAGGFDKNIGKDRYYHEECIKTLVDKFKNGKQKMLVHMATGLGKTRLSVALVKALLEAGMIKRVLFIVDRILLAKQAHDDGFSLISKDFNCAWIRTSNFRQQKHANVHIVVIDTLENIYQEIPSNFYDLIIVDECHRSININRKLIFDHFLCPRIGLTATPKNAIAKKGANVSEEDLEILDTYKLFGCETGEPDYQFDLAKGIDEGFLAPYNVLEIKTYLTKEAEEKGVEFDYVLDPDERKKILLDETKKLMLEQLERKYLSEDRALRIAEEIKKNTEYGEKVLLFGVSQSHCLMLTNALNKVFSDGSDEISPRYAEAIISDNSELNETLKAWFKKVNRKPYIAVSVDIMSTGVDIPCIRYIGFAALTKSVGKYIQMLGRGTRLDPKSGKFSFKVLDFVGLCKRMDDNGQGTPKKNIKIVDGKDKGGGHGPGPRGDWFIIDNPDPENLIQRVWIHEGRIEVKDNIPIAKAQEIFEKETLLADKVEIVKIKNKVEEDVNYQPTEKETETIKEWAKDPQIFLEEEQLKKIYNYPQGSIWDFFLQALGKKRIPTLEERIEKGFDSYIKTYNFTDEQIKILGKLKNVFAANIVKQKTITIDDIFASPVYEKIIGRKEDVDLIFGNKFSSVVKELESAVKVY